MKERISMILIKWAIQIGIVVLFWYAGLFHVLFAIFLLFLDQVNLFLEWVGTGTQLEAKGYWIEYGRYWLLAYIVLSAIMTVVYFIPYRHHRPILRVGDRKEGTVTFIKGLRRGLHYELWDTYNFLIKKNHTGWPDPYTINRGQPMGLPHTKVIFFRHPWSLKIRYLYVPRKVPVESRFTSVNLPDGYLKNTISHRLDIQDLEFCPRSTITYRGTDPEKVDKMFSDHLDDSRDAIQKAVASNPEINQQDFTTSSWAVLGFNDD
jgi:hypothetical protein